MRLDPSPEKSNDLTECEDEEIIDESDLDKSLDASQKCPMKKVYTIKNADVVNNTPLPHDWVPVKHISGITIYYHTKTKVVTLSKPYHFARVNLKFHKIPLYAMPCLALKLENEEKERNKKGIEHNPEERHIKVHEKTYIHPVKMRDYCSSMFEITEEIVPFEKKISEDYVNPKIASQNLPEIETLGIVKYKVDGYKYEHGVKEPCVKEGTLNLYGKTWTCLLHEFAQKVYFAIPEYVGEEKDQSYSYFVRLDGKEYATVSGPSKKIAKAESARIALFTLIPELDSKPDISKMVNSKKSVAKMPTEQDLEFFNSIPIDDVRVAELSTKLALPTPSNLLKVCFNRMCIPDSYLKVNHQTHGNRHNIEMTFNGETVKAVSRNKKDGMNICSQKVLRILHPQLKSWGELLNLYGPKTTENNNGEIQENEINMEKIENGQERLEGSCQKKIGNVDEAKKSRLISILRSKMLELSEKWDTLDIVKRKGKFFEKPEKLPVITHHPDALTSVYSSVPQTVSVQSKGTKRSRRSDKRNDSRTPQQPEEYESSSKLLRIEQNDYDGSLRKEDECFDNNPRQEDDKITLERRNKFREELDMNDDEWGSMKDFLSTDKSEEEEGEI